MATDIYSGSGASGQIMYVFVCTRAFVCTVSSNGQRLTNQFLVHPVVNRHGGAACAGKADTEQELHLKRRLMRLCFNFCCSLSKLGLLKLC